MDSVEYLARFQAKFKQMTVNSRDGFAHLEFKLEHERAADAYPVLQTLGVSASIKIECDVSGFNPLDLPATFEELNVDQVGRVRVKYLVAVVRAPELLGIVSRDVVVEVKLA